MEPLSPRSTNLPLKPGGDMDKKTGAKEVPSQKELPQKTHASPPPSILREPGREGEEYITGNFLGKGGFAVCYEGKLSRNGRLYAMKVVKSEMHQKKMQEKFRTELQIHSKMRHPNIVEFYRAFAFEKNTYVILELCPNGSVMDMVRKRKCLSLPEVRRFMIQLCGAVKYMHKRNVAHRDLKMGNLFLDQHMDIKVGDFGLAAIIVSEKDERRRRTLCGTPNYIAPEVLDKSKGGHNQKVDIWSLGVIFFAMLTGYPPFQSKTQEEIYKKVKNVTYGWPKESDCANYIPPAAKSLASCCLSLEEEERPEPDEIVEHDFFNMYPGCIPRQLDPSCRYTKPAWIQNEEPRGDATIAGHGLDYDEKYLGKISLTRDAANRYAICKDEFYAECGVGKMPSGSVRKSAGRRCSRSAYAECAIEEEKGLQPVIPLPDDRVYSYQENDEDWSLPKAATIAHTQSALAAAQKRRKETQSQSHAAVLRQQALPNRQPSRKTAISRDTQPNSKDIKGITVADTILPAAAPPRLFGEKPIRTRGRTASAYTKPLRDRDDLVSPSLPTSNSVPIGLTIGKTRSQSRLQLAATAYDRVPLDPSTREANESTKPTTKPTSEKGLYKSVKPAPVGSVKIGSSQKRGVSSREQAPTVGPEEQQQQNVKAEVKAQSTSNAISGSAPSNGTNKSRSTLGLSPLIHPDERAEVMAGTKASEVIAGLRELLAQISPSSSISPISSGRRRHQQHLHPHIYVVKWVDYTNRYGIGYVLDDGSVGCVFKSEHGRPASCVVVRDGERHIRRKAYFKEGADSKFAYSENNQLVPRNGKPVEFYENIDTQGDEHHEGGIKRVLVQPYVFEVLTSNGRSGGTGIRIRIDASIEAARCEAEKVKRVKLVDQFGKYMIGTLGRGVDEERAMSDERDVNQRPNEVGQYVKFYQRLGNVGIWGFGDGAFQFNFPDHTKLVLSVHRPSESVVYSRIDFYHLSPSAARYLAAKGKMHPSGFDTRSVISDETSTFFNALSDGNSRDGTGTSVGRLREILETNSFREKIEFIKETLANWIQHGRLGARSSATPPPLGSSSTPATISSTLPSTLSGTYAEKASYRGERFWDGVQEKTWAGPGGGKFVWVTVGAQEGDEEYVSVSLKTGAKGGDTECVGSWEKEELRNRLKALEC